MAAGWSAWLGLLPGSLVQRRPALLLARGWLHYLRYQLQAIPPLLKPRRSSSTSPSPADAEAAEPLRGELTRCRAPS